MRGSLKKALMANLNAQMFGDTDEKILMSSYYVHGVLKAGILKWFAIPFSSGPISVRPLQHALPVLGGPTGHGLVSLS